MKNISKSFIATILLIIIFATTLAYLTLLGVAPNLGNGFKVTTSLIFGLFVFPVGLLLMITVVFVFVIAVILVLNFFNSISKVTESESIALEDTDVIEYLNKNYSTEQSLNDLTSTNYALSSVERKLNKHSLNVKYKDYVVGWYFFDGMHLTRFYVDQPTAPTLIINSMLNDNTRASIDISRLNVETIDLGSDFGNYISVGYIEETEVDALQVIDPSLMLTLLKQSYNFDIVVGQSTIDFKFANIHKLEQIPDILEMMQNITSEIQKKVAKKRNTAVNVAISLKKLGQSVDKTLDSMTINMLKYFGVLITAIILYSVTSSFLPEWLSIVILMIGVIIFLRILFTVSLIGYIFAISIGASIFIYTVIRIRVNRLKRRFRNIEPKYS